ncbi:MULTISPECIES: DUF3800 domain-containing protein [Rhizobium]|uniref:DUF3800 domain-containing protein n=3 Tax=Rhizobium/Agrobacterium group TaxID=227290 RepID=A0ABR5CNT7_9HYPH|nr:MULTISPECIES: DUF3800 domain-containing protein [Rhizobium]KAA3503942.1 DUF3800 domain-containing protein [Rhizobium rhizogenes]KJF66384.1 hypothetical protein RS75_17520 [Rhizobium nepotum 39/7]
MVATLNLYLDDSGTRHPTRKIGKKAAHGYDWFSLGGILVHSEDEEEARSAHRIFCEKWELKIPLHSSEIRSQKENFEFLRGWAKEKQNLFYEELYLLMRDVPVVGIACVVDRPGYNSRYLERYEQNPWMLCKTAFSVVVERGVKHAIAQGVKLRVHPERCNKEEDARLDGYYKALKADGMPFAKDTSEKYAPLSQEQFTSTLYEFQLKNKTSPMAQFADLYLWPMCMGGYHAGNKTYARLIADGKLIECRLSEEDHSTLGSKYSCFENVERKP